MIVIQRRNKIKELLIKQRTVKVNDLACEFGVSEETIRRDLTQLEQDGLVKKNYGGAILVEELENAMATIPPVRQRQLQHYEEKDAIGKMAASLAKNDQILILDAGSTTWCVTRHIKHLSNITVVTNGINIADELSQMEEASIFVIGGMLVKKSMSLVGPQAESELNNYNADIAFLGTSGISLAKGFTSSDIYEAEVKRAMVVAADKVVIVADHSKLQRQGLISFSTFDHVDTLVTSDLADPSVLRQIEKMGVEIVICPLGKNAAAS